MEWRFFIGSVKTCKCGISWGCCCYCCLSLRLTYSKCPMSLYHFTFSRAPVSPHATVDIVGLFDYSPSIGDMLVTQSCPTVCVLMGCSLPGSSVHGILQTRILERVVVPFFRESSWTRHQTWVSCIAGRFFTVWTTREVQEGYSISSLWF